MMLDINGQFSSAQAVTATALSTKAIDLRQGLAIPSGGAYTNPPDIIGNVALFGMDFGIGNTQGVPRIVGTAIAAFTAAGAATMQVQFQGVVDPNNGTLAGAAWVTYGQTDTIAKTLLTASTRIFSFDWPMRKIGQALPRFVVLNYVVATGPMTAGTVTADLSVGGADDATGTLGQYPANFTVAP
jgi:hypothetical protein